jgi:hypothetical protein
MRGRQCNLAGAGNGAIALVFHIERLARAVPVPCLCRIVGRSNRMERYAGFLSLVIFLLCGCSDATQPPARFSRQISSADRLEVTNRHYALGKTITGADVRRLTTAMQSAKKKTWGARMDWNSPRSWDVEFFAGTNRLAVIPLCYGVFKLERAEYSDGTGFVEAFGKKLEALKEQRTR